MPKKPVKKATPREEPTLATLLQHFEALSKSMSAGFQEVRERFEQIDQRFEQQDRRFEQQDQRFLQQDQRFLQQDQRFQSLEALVLRIEQELRKEMKAGFEEIKERMRKDNIEGGDYLQTSSGSRGSRRFKPHLTRVWSEKPE